jgi:hypothetical protein
MPHILSEQAIAEGDLPFTAQETEALFAPLAPQCGAADAEILRTLEPELMLHRGTRFASTSAEACTAKRATTGAEVLTPAVDDPDKGMDDDLPDEYDPAHDRPYLGGTKGPPSKGFRHVYFRAWNLLHPITTFHLPPRALGANPARLEFLVTRAKRELARRDRKPINFRVLGWALHYLQDLTQPFHTVMTPSPRMVAWYALWTWPPTKGFRDLEKETARSVTNYHWAVEGYVRDRLMEKGEMNPFAECLAHPAAYTSIPNRTSIQDVQGLVSAVLTASTALGPELGSRAVAFFGHDLTLRDKDFTKGTPQPVYSDMAIRPDLEEARRAFHETVCKCLANSSWASRWLIRYALQ